ncbi:hypothetical protein C0J52_09764 [Blattella germanica]|nr:hypothetical protein C0J52_09764 [Blattella germanica]
MHFNILGKRTCVGESLARNNIFLTFAVLLQNYTLRIPDGEPTPSTFPQGGLILTTKPFKIRMTPRPL